MEDLVRYIACSLVDEPERVETVCRDERIELKVAEPDLGKVIGRQGRTIKAMRVLLSAAAARQGQNLTLDVVE